MPKPNLGPRRLSNAAWLRYKARRLQRMLHAFRTGQEQSLEQVELAYKSGYDAGLEKGKLRGRQECNTLLERIKAEAKPMVLEVGIRSQRHQDFILLVQTLALANGELAAASIVAEAMDSPPPNDETEFAHDNPRVLIDFAGEFVLYRSGKGPRPDWLPPGVLP